MQKLNKMECIKNGKINRILHMTEPWESSGEATINFKNYLTSPRP